MAKEYSAEELNLKAIQRQNEILAQKKITIMENLFKAATKDGKTEYAINSDLLDVEIRTWLTGLGFIIHDNVITWA